MILSYKHTNSTNRVYNTSRLSYIHIPFVVFQGEVMIFWIAQLSFLIQILVVFCFFAFLHFFFFLIYIQPESTTFFLSATFIFLVHFYFIVCILYFAHRFICIHMHHHAPSNRRRVIKDSERVPSTLRRSLQGNSVDTQQHFPFLYTYM